MYMSYVHRYERAIWRGQQEIISVFMMEIDVNFILLPRPGKQSSFALYCDRLTEILNPTREVSKVNLLITKICQKLLLVWLIFEVYFSCRL